MCACVCVSSMRDQMFHAKPRFYAGTVYIRCDPLKKQHYKAVKSPDPSEYMKFDIPTAAFFGGGRVFYKNISKSTID